MRRFLFSLLLLWAGLAHAQEGVDELVYQADFDRDWTAGHDRNLVWQPTNQGLALTSLISNAPAHYVDGTSFEIADFYLELTFVPTACDNPQSALLLNVRADPHHSDPLNARAYVFVMQCDGGYRARAVETGGTAKDLDFEGQLPLPLNLQTPVNFGIWMQDTQAAWYWEGELLGEFETTQTAQTGQIVIGAQLGLDVIIRDLSVWNLAESTK